MQPRRLAGLDIETACAKPGCTDSQCNHALHPHFYKITVIGLTDGHSVKRVYRGVDKIQLLEADLKNNPELELTAHNGKFDIKNLIVHGANKQLLLSRWTEDSSLLAFNCQDKIPPEWLEAYDYQRVDLNKSRKGIPHRKAGPHSLKTTAPYYLGVAPFWEAEDHDDDEYVLKDAEYSLRLTELFLKKLPIKSIKFYKENYFPWTVNLLEAELAGIKLDEPALDTMLIENKQQLAALDAELSTLWAPHYKAWLELQQAEIRDKYDGMLKKALAKKGPKGDELKTITRYDALYKAACEKIEPLNLASPAQLAWLLRDRLGLNPVNLDGETSTDKEALELLGEQSEDVKKLITLRKLVKLSTAFLPEYKAAQVNGRIHTTFNVTEARTGRLSSSNLNMQQVPGDLHKLFVADEGKSLIVFDLGAIEPTVLAYYSEDPQLCELMINKGDFHSTNAKAMFGLEEAAAEVKKKYPKYRNVAKTVGLAVLYGAGANQVHRTLLKNGLHNFTLQDSKDIVYRIRDLYKGVWEFKKALDKEMEQGATIYNLLGRPLRIQDPQDAYMKSMNTLIQSSASDLLQRGAYEVKKQLGLQPLLLVHDEVVMQAIDSEAAEVSIKAANILIDFTLNTKYGKIPIRVEGGVNKVWAK